MEITQTASRRAFLKLAQEIADNSSYSDKYIDQLSKKLFSWQSRHIQIANGDQFESISDGPLEVVEHIKGKTYWVKFLNTGHQQTATHHNIIIGKVKDRSIISKNLERLFDHTSRAEVSDWYKQNYVKGWSFYHTPNTPFTPENCAYVPPSIFSLLIMEPISGTKTKRNGRTCYRSIIRIAKGKRKTLGTFSTPTEARTAHQEYRKSVVRTFLLDSGDEIPTNTRIVLTKFLEGDDV